MRARFVQGCSSREISDNYQALPDESFPLHQALPDESFPLHQALPDESSPLLQSLSQESLTPITRSQPPNVTPEIVKEAFLSATTSRAFHLALSGDGLTMALGAPDYDDRKGKIFLFKRPDNHTPWIRDGPGLQGARSTAGSCQGYSLSLSADGKRIAFGAPGYLDGQGAVWLFERRNLGDWREVSQLDGLKKVDAKNRAPHFGKSVALSGDGSTLAVGSPRHNSYPQRYYPGMQIGAVSLYFFADDDWHWQAQLQGGVRDDRTSSQGENVALSFDGNTLAICGSKIEQSIAEVFLFRREASVWHEEEHEAFFTDENAYNHYWNISLSRDGNCLAIGGSCSSTNRGTSWIYRYSEGAWRYEIALALGNTVVFGYRRQLEHNVALAGDGQALAISGVDEDGQATIWIYQKEAQSGWVHHVVITVYPYNNTITQSVALAFSEDGCSLLSSDPNYIDDCGVVLSYREVDRVHNHWSEHEEVRGEL